MIQEFKIFGIPMNLNEYRNAHFFLLDKEKKKWERITVKESIAQRIRPIRKCRLTIEFYFKDRRRHDPDNYSASLKFILDGMVKANILPDDDFSVIESLTVRQGGIHMNPYLVIRIEELEHIQEDGEYERIKQKPKRRVSPSARTVAGDVAGIRGKHAKT